MDETDVKVAGDRAYVYRAADDAATFFQRAIEATGVVPEAVTTDCAATYPPTLAVVLPEVPHETGKLIQQRIERDHQHRKGRVRGMRGFKTLAGARVLCHAHAFLRNLCGGFYDLGSLGDKPLLRTAPLAMHAWNAPTTELLARWEPLVSAPPRLRR